MANSDVVHWFVAALGELLEVDAFKLVAGSVRDGLPDLAHGIAAFALSVGGDIEQGGLYGIDDFPQGDGFGWAG